MDFINNTDYQADCIWGPAGETSLGIAVIAKATYEVLEDGTLAQTLDKPWPVHFEEFETPYGKFPSEYHPFRKPRVDLIICGFAYSDPSKKASQVDVNIRVKDFSYTLKIFGDRFWEKQDDVLVPSVPAKFEKIALTLDNAFGGSVENEFGKLEYPFNPAGKGYYLNEEQALGSPLPNIESPDEPITSFEQKPRPVAPCVYPQDGGLRLSKLPEIDKPETRMIDIAHLIYCWAHPDLTISDDINPGDEIVITGIRPEGAFKTFVPEFMGRAQVAFDHERWDLSMKLDTIIVLGEERRVVFRWWGSGVFEIIPRQKRIVELSAIRTGEIQDEF